MDYGNKSKATKLCFLMSCFNWNEENNNNKDLFLVRDVYLKMKHLFL